MEFVTAYVKLKTQAWKRLYAPPDELGAGNHAGLLGDALFGLQPGGKALNGHRGWQPAWRDAAPKAFYDTVIVGGGGHGLATAYYLAKEHGITDVAVVEKGWIGSGNAGRNTTIIRSNYREPGNIPLYELSMKLWEGVERDLNYNAMVSQRGVVNLYHSDAQRDAYARRGNMSASMASMRSCWTRRHPAHAPFLDFDNARFPHSRRPVAETWRHRAP